MFQEFFQLNDRPFNTTPYAPDYFPARYAEQSLQAARIALREGTGTVLIVGPTGVGKSMLLTVLATEFRNEFTVVCLTSTSLSTRRELLQNILFELDRPYQGKLEGELRLDLMEQLKPSEKCPNGIMILVDEAHCLADEVLDELKSISNYHREGRPRVRIALAGGTRLEETLTQPKFDSLSQRISCRCYLQPMSTSEVHSFIDMQIRRAGSSIEKVFEADAIEAIVEITNGIPRLINQVCCHSMILAACNGIPRVNRNIVGETWADIQKLPNPWKSDRNQVTDSDEWSVVEFGELDQQPAESEQSFAADVSEHKAELATEPTTELPTEPQIVPPLTAPAISEFQQEPTAVEQIRSFVDDSPQDAESSLGQFSQSIDTSTVSMDQVESQPVEPARPQEIQLQQTNTAEPLFGDGFDDEEEVVDEFTRWAADQNRVSLEVTKTELEDLTSQAENIRQQIENQSGQTNIGPEVVLSVSPETRNDSQSPPESTDSPSNLTADPEIKQMFEIYDNQKQLADQVSVAVQPVDHNDQFNFGDPRLANPTAIEYPIEEHATYRKTLDNQDPPPVTRDDRDMLVVSHVDETPTQPQAPEPTDADQNIGPESHSTGTAIRMNYQELFDRLRADETQSN